MSIKELLTQLVKRVNMPVIFNSGSATVNSATGYRVATITLPANGRYLVLSHTYSNASSTYQISNQIYASGASEQYGGNIVRAPMTNGGGVINWSVIETGSSACTAYAAVYGYYTSSHTEYGRIIAIPLYRGGTVKGILSTSLRRWHHVYKGFAYTHTQFLNVFCGSRGRDRNDHQCRNYQLDKYQYGKEWKKTYSSYRILPYRGLWARMLCLLYTAELNWKLYSCVQWEDSYGKNNSSSICSISKGMTLGRGCMA